MGEMKSNSSAMDPTIDLTVIEPPRGWQLVDWRELWQYRDLFRFLVWRDVKTRYAQSILGVGWAHGWSRSSAS